MALRMIAVQYTTVRLAFLRTRILSHFISLKIRRHLPISTRCFGFWNPKGCAESVRTGSL